MKRCLLLITGLVLLAMVTTGFLFIPFLPGSLISGITVENSMAGEEILHVLDQSEVSQLLAALTGNVRHTNPPPLVNEVNWTLHLRGPVVLRYTVGVTENREMYLQNNRGKTVSLTAPDFFITHPAFAGMNPHAVPPSIQIHGLETPLRPTVTDLSWSYARLDNQWVHINPHEYPAKHLLPPSDQSAILPVLKTPDASLRLAADPYPDTITLQLVDPGGRRRTHELPIDGTLPLYQYNGMHEYHLEMAWTDPAKPYQGSMSAHFQLAMDFPTVFEWPGPTVLQGELLEFRIRHLPPETVPAIHQSLTDNLLFYPDEDGLVAYVPTHYGTAPGDYRIRYGLADDELQDTLLTILPRNFHVQSLTIDAGVAAATRNEEAAAMTARYFSPSRDHSASERYYTEPFVIPVAGRLTTEFGETRTVNNAPTSYRHSGLDIAAPTGTPVAAVNRGKVVLSMELITQGNTVVIDHGQGLFSVYFHLDELHAVENTIVERGEIIGTVGSTGFSTGPHLHLTMSYFRHNLEPGHFLVGEPLTYQNAPHYLAPTD